MSCCGSKNSKYYTRTVGKTCCNYNYGNDCCGSQSSSNTNSCCGNTSSNTNSCCKQTSSNTNSCCNQTNSYYNQTTSNTNSCCDCCCNTNEGLDGISCQFHANNDCCCKQSLNDALCELTNQRVIIHTDGCKMCVVIVSVGDCFVKTINPCTHKIVYFNINRIDNVEDGLPRCYS